MAYQAQTVEEKALYCILAEEEARHHSMGAPINTETITDSIKQEMFEFSRRHILNTINNNPVLSGYEMLFGKLAKKDKLRFFDETNTLALRAKKAHAVKEITQRNNFHGIYEMLEKDQCFKI